MGETRRKFDQDFREGAVRLVRETGKPIAQVARDLGVNEGTLGNWVNADKRRRGEGNGALAELGRLEPGMMPVLLARHLGPGSGHGPGHLADGARHRSRRDRVPGAQLGKGPDRTGRHGVSGRAYSSSQTEHTG